MKSGHQIYVAYRDLENTFPGHSIDREAIVYVREPTDGTMRIVATQAVPPIEELNRPMQVSWSSIAVRRRSRCSNSTPRRVAAAARRPSAG